EQNSSAAKTIHHLVRNGDKATVETRAGGPTQRRTIDWNKDWLSESAADDLRKEKLKKGEKEFTCSIYSLESGESTVTTKVVGMEKVDVKGGGSRNLLRLNVANTARPGPSDAWVDDHFDE